MKGKKKSDEKRDGVLSWTVEGRGFFLAGILILAGILTFKYVLWGKLFTYKVNSLCLYEINFLG